LISDLQEQEMTLKQCIEQLESVDAARISLINQLKEALSEQESKSVVLRSQLQVRIILYLIACCCPFRLLLFPCKIMS